METIPDGKGWCHSSNCLSVDSIAQSWYGVMNSWSAEAESRINLGKGKDVRELL